MNRHRRHCTTSIATSRVAASAQPEGARAFGPALVGAQRDHGINPCGPARR